MNIDEKERLALTRNSDPKAMGIRLRAARFYAGLSQEALGKIGSVKKAAISNAETGSNKKANLEIMRYFYRSHGIDFNFFLDGDFLRLDPVVQDKIFEKLSIAHSELGQK